MIHIQEDFIHPHNVDGEYAGNEVMTHTGDFQTVVSALHNHKLPPRHFTVTAAPAHTGVRRK